MLPIELAVSGFLFPSPPPPPPLPPPPSIVFAFTPPPWTVYMAVCIILCTIVYQKAVGVGAPKKGAPSTTAESTKMPAKEEQDNVEPSTFIAAHAYSGYAYLFGRGYTLDFIQFLLKYLLFWRKELSVSSPRAGPDIASKYGPPFNSGWVIFYKRRLYSRIEDCWNRPIAGEAATSIDVCLRERDGRGDAAPLVRTGKTRHCLNLGSYNYLGFGGVDPICTPAVISTLRKYGVSACSSRMEAGTTPVHAELEGTVASFLEKKAAIVIGMGFATNSFVIPVLVDPEGHGKGVLLISDALNHSSIVEGVRGSGAKVQPFAHNDMGHLEAVLKRATENGQPSGAPWRKIIILVEGIYSMEGQFAKLRDIVALKKKYNAYLYLDEAHSIGAVGPRGRGVTDHLGIDTKDVDVMMGTFTKSFGSVGGYIAGEPELISALRRHSAASLYSSAMSPPAAQQALSALRIIMGVDEQAGAIGTQRMSKLRQNSNRFRAGLIRIGCRVLGDVDSPVIPIMLYHPEKINNFSQACLKRNVAVVVVGYPATPLLLSRARFCIAASHTEAELDECLLKIAEAAQEVGVRYDRGTPPTTANDPDAAAFARMVELKSAPVDSEIETNFLPEELCAPPPPGVPDPARQYELALKSTPAGEDVEPGLDLRTTDFLKMGAAKQPRDAAEAALNKYGCGTCGPRGFYGTLDVHLDLEQKLADFLQVEAAIIYSFGIATPSSVIPAFVRKGDLLLYDEGIHFTTQVGVKLARGTAHSFDHNDMSALEAMLTKHANAEKKLPANKRSRRFILVEGLYANGGGLCPLPELIRLRDAFGCYLIVDESLSFGTMGKTGRGIAEHYNMPPKCIDVLIGTMENSLASVGGFCAGPAWVVSHQRLSGSGYCFSASLPAYATTAAMAAIDLIVAEPQRLAKLHQASKALSQSLKASFKDTKHVQVLTHPDSPIAHVGLTPAAGGVLSSMQLEQALRDAAANCAKIEGGAAVQLMLHSSLSHVQAPRQPSIRLTVNSETPPAYLPKAIAALATSMSEALAKHANALRLVTVDPEITISDGSGDASALFAEPPKSPLKALPSFTNVRGAADEIEKAEQADLALGNPQAAGSFSPGPPNPIGAPEVPPVTTPLLFFLEYVRQVSRNYVLRQMEWHAFSLAPQLARLRATRSTALHWLLTVGHFLGSEYFYFSMVPVLCWALADNAHINSNLFVAYFSLNIYVGNWLKNCFALARADDAPTSRDTSDFGWPSMYSLNAVGLPFFALRSAFGAFGSGTLYSLEHQLLTATCYTGGILWVCLVCGARLYSGASSPADVQGGMLVGGVLVRVWLPICEYVNDFLVARPLIFGLPQWLFLGCVASFLMLIHPFTPGDPRSWTAIAYSAKAISFATAFIVGSNSCAENAWCAASRTTWVAALTFTSISGLVVRCAVGFAIIFIAGIGAANFSTLFEARLKLAFPNKPCVGPIARNIAVYTTYGVMVSLGVPAVLTAAGL